MTKRRITATEIVSIGHKIMHCPECGCLRGSHSSRLRKLIDVDGRKRVKFAYHWCKACKIGFNNEACKHVFWGKSNYSAELVRLALNLLKGHTLAEASRRLKSLTGVSVGTSTIHDWDKTQGEQEWDK